MNRQEYVDHLIANSPLLYPDAGIDEQTLANRAAEAMERIKTHDMRFLSIYEQTAISDALAQSLGLPTQGEIPE